MTMHDYKIEIEHVVELDLMHYCQNANLNVVFWLHNDQNPDFIYLTLNENESHNSFLYKCLQIS